MTIKMLSYLWTCLIVVGLARNGSPAKIYSGNGETPEHWRQLAKEDIHRSLKAKPNVAVAKNVILFVGDGMGVSTVTAARILAGQLQGRTGEEHRLSFENFPHIALTPTYNQDRQVPDSAGCATALMCGIKGSYRTLGLDASAQWNNCSMLDDKYIDSILDWSLAAGKSVGIVTTTRVTHATPAALYAQTPNRNWEADYPVPLADRDTCKDIARQLVEDNPGIQVILGGGRRYFLPNDTVDPETGVNIKGRTDGRNLIQDWILEKKNRDKRVRYVWNATEFAQIDPEKTDYLLGLFDESHMQYELDRVDPSLQEEIDDPSLADMTAKAIQILQKNENGYFLLVEGGRIDHAHHDSYAIYSLHDTVAFSQAIDRSSELTSQSDTLSIVTADHSHVFSIAGYPSRGNPILGKVDMSEGDKNTDGNLRLADDNMPYTTLLYANGQGYHSDQAYRYNISDTDTTAKTYQQQSAVPLNSETHGGEDVAVYARGPMSHLFHGVHDQTYVAHVMAYASCVGEYSDDDNCAAAEVAKIARPCVEISGGSLLSKVHMTCIMLMCVLSKLLEC